MLLVGGVRLYHFTDKSVAWAGILGDMALKRERSHGSITALAGGAGFSVTQPRPGISLTTNPRLVRTTNSGGDGRPWNSVRLEIDGDVLASRGIKLEPYLDEMHGITLEDDQQEILVRQDEVSLKGALVGIEVNPEEHLYNVAANSIEQVYDEKLEEHFDMPMEQKLAKYRDYEIALVREFIDWCRETGIPVKEVTEFSLPQPVERALLSGSTLLQPPSVEPELSTSRPGPEV